MYKDIRGIAVPSDRIHKMLHEVEIPEEDIIEFLGKEYSEIDGAFVTFLDMLHTQKIYFKQGDSNGQAK